MYFVVLNAGLYGVYAQTSKVDMTKWMTPTVKEGTKIKLDFAAATGDIWVKVSGVKEEKEENAPTSLTRQKAYETRGTTLTVYGAIEKFNCSNNYGNLTAIDVTKNESLKNLECSDNQISSLDVARNVQLEGLCIYGNHFPLVPLTASIASCQTEQGNWSAELFILLRKVEISRNSSYGLVIKL